MSRILDGFENQLLRKISQNKRINYFYLYSNLQNTTTSAHSTSKMFNSYLIPSQSLPVAWLHIPQFSVSAFQQQQL